MAGLFVKNVISQYIKKRNNMPKELERKLKRQVAGKNWSEERKDAYVYGTLRKTGWTPSHQRTAAYKKLKKK